MDTGAPEATVASEVGLPSSRRRRMIVAGLAATAVLVIAALVLGATAFSDARPTFALEGPTEAVAPGASVEVLDPDHECGPLIVSLHRRGALGLWSQTHSGDVYGGFRADARPWWVPGGEYTTPVPCLADGTTTFDLPDDLWAGVIAACDTDGRCARVRVAG